MSTRRSSSTESITICSWDCCTTNRGPSSVDTHAPLPGSRRDGDRGRGRR
jgi:hypothetical protein